MRNDRRNEKMRRRRSSVRRWQQRQRRQRQEKAQTLQQNRLNSNGFCMDDAKVSLVFRAEHFVVFHFVSFHFVFCCTFFTFSFNRSDIHMWVYTLHIQFIHCRIVQCWCKQMHAFNGNTRANGFFNRTITHHISHRHRQTGYTNNKRRPTKNDNKQNETRQEVKGVKKR